MTAGGLAGTTVDLSLYPIDTLKTRLQASSGFAASGGFSGIYKGVGSAVVGSAPGAALFFVTYEGTKSYLNKTWRSTRGRDEYLRDSAIHMAAASIGEVAACAVRVPTEVVKQRAQASQHPSSLAAFRYILSLRESNGFGAMWSQLYRGWAITIFREVPFTIIQFPLWEAMKKWQCRRRHTVEATATESAIFGCVSGGVAAAVTTPLDVLKTRMMLSTERVSLGSLSKTIWRVEGSRAFLGGIIPRIGWISAGGAIFLGSYQWASNTLSSVV
ncbi:MAG: hypothetical protein Q9162_005785 [Coniocarpon cinnabarinum]